MKHLVLKPSGWPCRLDECPPGLFVYGGEWVGMKTEYGNDEAYCDSGERFCGDANRGGTTGATMVQPVRAEWEDSE